MAPNKRSAEQLQEVTAASESLIQQLDTKRQTFNKGKRPLLPKEDKLLRSWFDVLRETAVSIANRSRSVRSVRQQARDFLGVIFLELGPEVFLLFTLTISVTKLVEIKCENLIPDVRSWWRDCPISEGLKQAASEACEANSISTLIASRSNVSNDGGKQKTSHVQGWATDQLQEIDHRPARVILHRTMPYHVLLSSNMMPCKMSGI
jgi:hypothetical protein